MARRREERDEFGRIIRPVMGFAVGSALIGSVPSNQGGSTGKAVEASKSILTLGLAAGVADEMLREPDRRKRRRR